MNTTPKARFHEHKAQAQTFLDIVDSEVFARATELAMLAFLEELDIEEAMPADCYQRIKGASRFLAILKKLPEPPPMQTARSSYNLDHTLK